MARSLRELKPATRWLGAELEVHDSLASTNQLAEERARSGAPDGTVILADRQTAGRGRLGRSFFSPGGRSLYLSVLLRPSCPPEQVHHHIFAAAVAVATVAREQLPPSVDVAIKWPNDIQLDGVKTSGINCPAHIQGAAVHWAILGIGVNVNTELEEFPPELRTLATSLRLAAGAPLDRVAVGEALLTRLEQQVDALRAGAWPRVLEAWRNFFKMQGSRVRVGASGGSDETGLEGVVRGVDPEGALLIDTASGRQRIVAGDVSLIEKPSGAEA